MDKVFYLDSENIKATPNKSGTGLRIAGYANTVDRDRVGDIILASAWVNGIENYRMNPILLFQHDPKNPIGRVNKITVDKKGIFIEATVSQAAEKIHQTQSLIKDGVLKSFSVGFRPIEQKYDNAADSTIITKVELLEVSVVSIPANQTSLFSIRKNFETDKEYREYCKQFETQDDTLLVGTTSLASKHYHGFEVDSHGNGRTNFTSHGFANHVHNVVEKTIQESDGHNHSVRSIAELSEEKIKINEFQTMTFDFRENQEETDMVKEVLNEEEDEDISPELLMDPETVDILIKISEDEVLENEEEEDEDEDEFEVRDPYELIPFDNLLSAETSRIENGNYVQLYDRRWKVVKIATSDSPSFQFKEVDINGSDKDLVINVVATNISVVNEWDLGTDYDLQLTTCNPNQTLNDRNRKQIKNTFSKLVTLTEKELYELKEHENIQDDPYYQAKLNKIMNLKSMSTEEWTDTNFVAAKNVCEMIKNLKAINPSEANIELALLLHGHKVIAQDEIKEKTHMTTQFTGDSQELDLPEDKQPEVEETSEAVEVSEPRVAELIEKTGEAMNEAADAAKENKSSEELKRLNESVAELRNELKSQGEQVSAFYNSKMEYAQGERNQNPFTADQMADAYLLAKGKLLPDDERIFDTKIGAKIKVVTSVDAFLSNFSETVQAEMEQELIIAPMLIRVQVDARNFRVPVADEDANLAVAQFASGTFATGIADTTNVPTSSQNSLSAVTFTPHKWMDAVHLAKDEEEDTILPLIGFLRAGAARRLARSIDKSLLRGDGSLTGFTEIPTGFTSVLNGMVTRAEAVAGDGLKVFTGANATQASAVNIATARARLGKYGIRVGTNDLIYLTTVEGYNELVQTADFRTVDTFGPQATYHTGVIGAIWGIPVMITEFMDNKGEDTTSNNAVGALIYKPGFLIAERRGIMVETEYEPRQQVTAVYMSTRLDMQALTTVASAALSNTYAFASVIHTGDGTI